MKRKSLIFIFALLFMIVISLSAVSADNPQEGISGEVSGDVDLASVNPWSTSGELNYDIPADAQNIKSVNVYVNVYGGSAKNTHGANANVSIKTVDGEKQIASEELWIEDGSSDGTVYPVNDHTTKCYSDYQMYYDITDSVKGLNGSSITLKVDTFKMDNKTFDGRIKLIALILAYDDGDSDVINYWVDSTQRWSKTNISTTFATKDANNIDSAELYNIMLSSGDGSYKVNEVILGDAKNHTSGDYYQYNSWDVTGDLNKGEDTEFLSMYAGTSAYGSVKNVLSLLKTFSIQADVSLATEYTNTCYAGTNNTITVNVNSNKAGRYTIELFADGVLVNSTEIDVDGAATLLLTDQTIRPVDETTVNGANNTKVLYAVDLKYGENVVAQANKTVPVLYNGNLGKDFAYNASYIEDSGIYRITGKMEAETLSDSTYMSAAKTNRSDVWEITIGENSQFVNALIYVAYNWDKSGASGPVFNTTFNGVSVSPKAHYRDQSNLGTYGKYGYGLFVYDVSSLVKEGNNTFIINKEPGLTAVYPSTLIYMTNMTGSDTLTTIFIGNGADLLSASSYNKAGRIVSTDALLNVEFGSKKLVNANLLVFAASAQAGEGNIIFNGEVVENVWNGSSNSVEIFNANVTQLNSKNNVSFVATGSTILALQQVFAVSQKLSLDTTLTPKILSTTYDSGKAFTIAVKDEDGNAVEGLKLNLKVFTGKSSKTYSVVTKSNGVATFTLASKLAIGTHKVEITSSSTDYNVKKTTSSIKVDKAKTTVSAPKVTAKVKKSKYFKVTVKNKATKKVVKNIKIKVKVYTGKKFKTYTVKTSSKGLAKLNTKSLKVGKHKVVVSSGNSKYVISAKSVITIKK